MIGTEAELRNEVARIALEYVGTKMGDAKHRYLIDTYNTCIKPLPRGYQVKYTDKYCCTACSVFALFAGIGDVFPLECGCYEALNKAKNNLKCWNEDDKYIAQKGDFIMFAHESESNENKYETTNNLEDPYHIMVIVDVDKAREMFICVSPNDKDHAILKREIPFNYKNIRGFVVPNYTKSKCYQPAPETIKAYATTELNLRQGPGVIYGKCNIEKFDGRGIRHTLFEGEEVEILEQKNGWCKILVKGRYEWKPWCSGKYLTVLK